MGSERWEGEARPLVWAVALAVAAVGTRAAQERRAEAIELTAARFFRPGAAETLVDVFCRIPVEAIARPDSVAGKGAFEFGVSVRDSGGLVLLTQSWSGRVSEDALRVPGAQTTQHFSFAARPGRYAVEVTVTGSPSDRVTRQRAEVGAFAREPTASDLLVATDIRPAVDAADTVPRGGEIRKGAVFLETSGRPVLTPQRSQLGYYLELYSANAESVTVAVRVRTTAGRQVIAATPQRFAVGAGGGTTQGVVDLGGLPPGDYRLELVLTTPDSQVVRAAEFGMAGFETARRTELAGTAAPTAADAFGSRDEAELDSLYMPLVYLMSPDEQGVFSGLTVDGKRAYLRGFWSKRNATPGGGRNETMERFYGYVQEANERFREGGVSRVPGWRTDRGRIFIKYGPPDEVLSRPQSGSTKPYEVWKYTRARGKKFIFMDLTQFGNYTLIWTDERREPSLPNWRVLLGEEAAADASRF